MPKGLTGKNSTITINGITKLTLVVKFLFGSFQVSIIDLLGIRLGEIETGCLSKS